MAHVREELTLEPVRARELGVRVAQLHVGPLELAVRRRSLYIYLNMALLKIVKDVFHCWFFVPIFQSLLCLIATNYVRRYKSCE